MSRPAGGTPIDPEELRQLIADAHGAVKDLVRERRAFEADVSARVEHRVTEWALSQMRQLISVVDARVSEHYAGIAAEIKTAQELLAPLLGGGTQREITERIVGRAIEELQEILQGHLKDMIGATLAEMQADGRNLPPGKPGRKFSAAPAGIRVSEPVSFQLAVKIRNEGEHSGADRAESGEGQRVPEAFKRA